MTKQTQPKAISGQSLWRGRCQVSKDDNKTLLRYYKRELKTNSAISNKNQEVLNTEIPSVIKPEQP